MSIAEVIARQQADKKRLARIVKVAAKPRQRSKRITKADVRGAVQSALEDVARDIRRKAKEAPGWAPAYHSACAGIEAKMFQISQQLEG